MIGDDETRRDREQDLVDAASEMSFPASDPPSYMGGAAIAGPPPEGDPPRPAASTTLVDPADGKVAGEAPSGTDPARVDPNVPRRAGEDAPPADRPRDERR